MSDPALPPIPRKMTLTSAFPFWAMRRLLICVDGVPQKFVLDYDIDAGTLTRFAVDPDGKVKVVRDGTHGPGTEEIFREVIKGKVTVEYGEASKAVGG